jgi:hypothetical protein
MATATLVHQPGVAGMRPGAEAGVCAYVVGPVCAILEREVTCLGRGDRPRPLLFSLETLSLNGAV